MWRAALALALFGAMALGERGIVGEIVNLAFGLTLRALAVAFVLGGREEAGKDWRKRVQDQKTQVEPGTCVPSAFPLDPRRSSELHVIAGRLHATAPQNRKRHAAAAPKHPPCGVQEIQ